MPDYRSEDEVTPSEAVILWSEPERMTPENRMTVLVRYPCSHQVYERDVHTLRRFRAQRPVTCEQCRRLPCPLPATRPLCAQCGRRLVEQRYKETLQGWHAGGLHGAVLVL